MVCKRYVVLLVLFGLLLAGAREGSAQPDTRAKVKPRGAFGVKIGTFGGGDIKLDGPSPIKKWETKGALGIGVFLDFYLFSKFIVAPTIDINGIKTWEGAETEYMLNPSLSLKYVLRARGSSFAFRPGIGIGYGLLTKTQPVGDSSYLTVAYSLETVVYTSPRFGLLAELKLFTAPSGGDGETDMTTDGAILVARVGILF